MTKGSWEKRGWIHTSLLGALGTAIPKVTLTLKIGLSGTIVLTSFQFRYALIHSCFSAPMSGQNHPGFPASSERWYDVSSSTIITNSRNLFLSDSSLICHWKFQTMDNMHTFCIFFNNWCHNRIHGKWERKGWWNLRERCEKEKREEERNWYEQKGKREEDGGARQFLLSFYPQSMFGFVVTFA
jgi:hypothetical protein